MGEEETGTGVGVGVDQNPQDIKMPYENLLFPSKKINKIAMKKNNK